MWETKKSGGWRTNKWFRAAIPALLLHCSIGTVYCWSIFSQEIADYIGLSKGATEWAFAGLTGNQMANWIVQHFGQEVEIGGNMVNPVGYQTVLYVTLALYVVALVLSTVFVKAPKENK